LKLCLKELRETLVWLKLIQELQLLTDEHFRATLEEADELVALFVCSVRTSEQKYRKRNALETQESRFKNQE